MGMIRVDSESEYMCCFLNEIFEQKRSYASFGFFKAKYPESEGFVNCEENNWSDEPLVEVWCKEVSAMEHKKSYKENRGDVDVLKSFRKTLWRDVSGTQNYR